MTEKLNLPAAFAGIKTFIRLPGAESTQTAARAVIEAGSAWPALVIADEQTAGRGRHGDAWFSGPGGLYLTLGLKTNVPSKELPVLSVRMAGAVSSALAGVYGIKTRIKEPNDVLAYNPARDEYLKICGIIAESAALRRHPEWLLIGIGVNINNALPKTLPAATTVAEIKGAKQDAREFAAVLLENFQKEYSEWESGAICRNGY
ncbi:MAG: biotin--[acetyl-CoA-carboxylase] ligase [Elusimicrobiaceae bacterium]|jgi:biotin-[acetyl-CoA-carboxylase] ligase BirA-like protein